MAAILAVGLLLTLLPQPGQTTGVAIAVIIFVGFRKVARQLIAGAGLRNWIAFPFDVDRPGM